MMSAAAALLLCLCLLCTSHALHTHTACYSLLPLLLLCRADSGDYLH